jgi:hypothetical protein
VDENLISDDLYRLHKLFEIVKAYVLNSGGDGDGWIISENFKDKADQFETYEKNCGDPWFIEKYENENNITFSNNQESISFVSLEYQLPEWAGDIIVRIH